MCFVPSSTFPASPHLTGCRWADHFDAALPRFRRYVDTLADFKKNHFNRFAGLGRGLGAVMQPKGKLKDITYYQVGKA